MSCRAGLAYCRHLSTVRTHLSALVNHAIVAPDAPCDAHQGLTAGVWQTFLQDRSVSIGCGITYLWVLVVDVCMLGLQTYEEEELLRLVYFGGVEASLRKEVWPFLLGHYQFGMSEDQRNEVLHSPLVQLPPAPATEVLTLDPSPAGG